MQLENLLLFMLRIYIIIELIRATTKKIISSGEECCYVALLYSYHLIHNVYLTITMHNEENRTRYIFFDDMVLLQNGAVQLGTQKTHGGFVCSLPLAIFFFASIPKISLEIRKANFSAKLRFPRFHWGL